MVIIIKRVSHSNGGSQAASQNLSAARAPFKTKRVCATFKWVAAIEFRRLGGRSPGRAELRAEGPQGGNPFRGPAGVLLCFAQQKVTRGATTISPWRNGWGRVRSKTRCDGLAGWRAATAQATRPRSAPRRRVAALRSRVARPSSKPKAERAQWALSASNPLINIGH